MYKITLIFAFILGTMAFVEPLSAQDNDSLAKWLVGQSGRAENPCGLAVLPEGGPLAMILTADAVLAVNDPINDREILAKRIENVYSPAGHATPLPPLPTDKPCQLIAYNRADGKERWRVSLPSEPVKDGLVVARDGSVIVQLLDGGVACVGQPASQAAGRK